MLKKFLVLFLVITLSYVAPAFAGEGTTGDYMRDIGTKAGRGLWNVLSSPAEIPCTIGDELAAKPQVGFLTGLGLGTVYMLRRILIGVTEVGTFMIPAERTIAPVCTLTDTTSAVTTT